MRVHLFVPCLAEGMAPEIGAAATACLVAVGCDVTLARGPTCCGQVFLNAGVRRRAVPLARRLVRALADAEHVVVPSGSCVAMIRDRYGDLLSGADLATWEALRGRCHELSDFLTRVAGVPAWPGALRARVALHWSCHLPRDPEARAAVYGLLGGIEGVELSSPPDDECCGFGGVFWTARRELSSSIGARRLHALSHDTPDVVVTLEPGCTLQLRESARENASQVRPAHLAEVLAESIGWRHGHRGPGVPAARPAALPSQGHPAVLKATAHSLEARSRALAEIDWPAAREALAAARERSAAERERLVAAVRDRALARGIKVFMASTAAEACEYVARLVGAAGPGAVVAKAKSMTGEEIGLRAAVDRAGGRAVETDLGEWIVDMRGEAPSHVTAPAIHLSRAEVAATFAGRLGMPPSDEPADLVAFARARLRADFLAAQVGLVGANALVAETGDIITVTNEGNGRMCQSLPPVVVVLAGVEKVIATLADAAALLRVLARNATGQRASVYVSLLRGPAGPADSDGPREVHLVLVDAGRTAIAADRDLAGILRCVRCGACMNACPVYRTAGGHAYRATYPGPMGIAWTAGLSGIPAAADIAGLCTLCGECARVCPAAIDLPAMILAVRERAPKPLRRRGALALAAAALRGPGWFATAVRAAAATARHLPGGYARLARSAGWTRPVPPPAPVPGGTRASVAAAQAAAAPRAQLTAARAVAPTALPAPAPSPPQPPADFRARFSDAGGELASGVAEAVAGIPPGVALVDRVAEEAGAARVLAEAGFTVHRSDTPGLDRTLAASACVGVTGCLALVNETGSILVGHGDGHDRLASLLPPVHVVLAGQAPVVATIEEALRIRDLAGCPAATLVTGPSRTADIEKVLVIGMHGPGRVVLVSG